jgi:hypothetical protein
VNEHLGEHGLAFGDFVALGGELGLVVIVVCHAHDRLVALNFTGNGGALQDHGVGDDVGRREGKLVWPPRGGTVGGQCGMSHEAQPFSEAQHQATRNELVCPYHHRLHHRGVITITGPAHQLAVTDSAGRELSPGSLARPPTRPPTAVPPCPGPTGERADWWWYEPFQPQPPPTNN